MPAQHAEAARRWLLRRAPERFHPRAAHAHLVPLHPRFQFRQPIEIFQKLKVHLREQGVRVLGQMRGSVVQRLVHRLNLLSPFPHIYRRGTITWKA
jgi:hypothetical protein